MGGNKMRCTYSVCQSKNTRLIERKVTIHMEGDTILDYDIDELWLCNNCGNAFSPGSKVMDLKGDKLTRDKFIGRVLGGLSFGFHPRYVQVKNPMTKRWVKIDRQTGSIIGHKQSPNPYKNVPFYSDVKPNTKTPLENR